MSEIQSTIEEGIVKDKLIPWITLWYRPKDTFRMLVDQDMDLRFFLLGFLYGIVVVLDRVLETDLGCKVRWVLKNTH